MRISRRHGLIARATTTLRVASASDGTHRARRTPKSRGKQRFILGPGNPLVTSPVTCGLAKVIIRPVVSHINGRRVDTTQRSVGHWRTGAQIQGRVPLGSDRRFPSSVNCRRPGRWSE